MGATALFSEKYGDVVRVVNMGGYSVELCGGTHLDNTAKVGPFRIEGEGSVASGVRRIEAVTGKACLAEMELARQRVYNACAILKTKPADLASKLESQVEEIKTLKKAIESFKAKESAGQVDRFLFGARNIGGFHVITTSVADADANKLRQMGDTLRDKSADVVAVLSAVNGDKITFLAVCGKNAVAKGLKAGELVKLVCSACGGSGGGKPDSAMGGGKDVDKIDDALALVDNYVSSKV
jgi:alanyl-tRNA synthetase